MEKQEYVETWSRLRNEYTSLTSRRVNLETELADLRDKIRRVDEVLTQLAPLADQEWWLESPQEDLSNLGLTDAIRHVLREATERMSAHDIKRELDEKRCDLSQLSAPMASIYKVLSRLEEVGEVEREKEENPYRVFFKWKEPEVTDEDIPF